MLPAILATAVGITTNSAEGSAAVRGGSHKIHSKGCRNVQTERKDQKRVVQKNRIPIMRLHRHGASDSLHEAAGKKRENPEIWG